MFKWAKLRHKKELQKEFTSPNGRIKCIFTLKSGEISYAVFYDNKPIVSPSRLGFLICGEAPLKNNLQLVRHQRKKHEETIELSWGENRFINNNYKEIAFYLAETKGDLRLFTVRFRVFDDAVAFRYEIPAQPKFQRVSIKEELTEFNFDLNTTAWKIPAYRPNRYEYNYEKCAVYDLGYPVHTPLTLRTPTGHYASIHEAALYNYGSMTLRLNTNRVLGSDITPLSDGTKAHIDLPFHTPWRLIMLANSAIELTTNHTMLALNDPPTRDFSWVNTLKFLGIWWAMYVGEWTWAPGDRHGATTKHAKEYIDAAVRLGISGLLIEGWNEGWEGDWLKEGVHSNFVKSSNDFDLEEVARYAKSRHIELVGHHETVGFVDNYEKQLESAYDLYAANGVHYIKTGYAGSTMLINGRREYHHSQLGVNHYQKTVELAAKKHICLDIHEPIKGTGIERTWPNLLSREGGRGQEYEGGSLQPSHACILPYTRLLSGGMDYTSGIFDIENPAKRIYTTLARQLAYYVVIYSGMQMAADRPHIYEKQYLNIFKFIRDVPTNFEITIPIAGEVGEYYIIARKDRNSENWYIGGVTDETPRHANIKLKFLKDATNYIAEIYSDSFDAHYKTQPLAIATSKKSVNSDTVLDIFMAPGGGFAIRLLPQQSNDA